MHLSREFESVYGRPPSRLVRSPLRICPLGAHVDHQHGLVTAMALDRGIDLAFRPEAGGSVRVVSADFPGEEAFQIDRAPGPTPGAWGNYLRGAVRALQEEYALRRGITGLVRGSLPSGGLSTSAAICTAFLLALAEANEIELSRSDLIRLGQWIENRFIGLNNGILDQAANVLSRAGHLLFLDCKTEEHRVVAPPPHMPRWEIALVDSGIRTALVHTEYNNRVDECRAAAWYLQELENGQVSRFAEARLRDVPTEALARHASRLPGRFARRARHFATECERVRQGVAAWEAGDLAKFGLLMTASGESSIRNYECGSPEMVTLYDILRETEGVYGTRFSGAGYRGFCVALIHPEARERIRAAVAERYPREHPEYADRYAVHFCGTGNGVATLPGR